MWWTYFDRFAEAAAERLREHDDPVLAAADAYSYLHLVIVAGIIIFAVGVKFLARDPCPRRCPIPRGLRCAAVWRCTWSATRLRLRMVGDVRLREAGRARRAAGALRDLRRRSGLGGGRRVAALLGALCAVESETGAPG